MEVLQVLEFGGHGGVGTGGGGLALSLDPNGERPASPRRWCGAERAPSRYASGKIDGTQY